MNGGQVPHPYTPTYMSRNSVWWANEGVSGSLNPDNHRGNTTFCNAFGDNEDFTFCLRAVLSTLELLAPSLHELISCVTAATHREVVNQISLFQHRTKWQRVEEADLVHNLVSDLVLQPGFKRPGFCVLSNSIPSGIPQWEIEGMEEGMELLSGLLPEKYLRIIMLLGQRLLLLSRQSSWPVSLLYVWCLFLSFMTSGSWSDNISSITRPRLLYIP